MKLVRASDATFDDWWSRLFLADGVQYPMLTALDTEYSKEYAADSTFEDVSFLVEENGVPLMGVRMAIRRHPDGRKEISGYGRPITYLESQALEPSMRDGAASLVREEMQKILLAHEDATAWYSELHPVLSPVGRVLLDTGGKASVHFTQVVNLLVPEAQLRSQIRKSYKSLLNWGAKNLALRVLDRTNVTAEAMEQFRQLHIEVAGRETRSQKSWDLQLEMVRQGEAFMVLGDLEGHLVTAALFVHSPKYCFYGVSAAKRELFEKPLGHILLWTAMLQAKAIGCQFFESGAQVFPQHGNPLPSPKELNISGFKKGFGGDTYPRIEIVWKK